MRSVIKGPSFKPNAKLINGFTWRQILGISLWNFIVLTFVFFFGRMIGDLPSYSNTISIAIAKPDNFDPANPDAAGQSYIESQAKRTHLTYIFNIFVFLQLFNMLNCRQLGKREFNIFEKPFHNFYFILMFVLIAAIQVLGCQYFPGITQTVPLTANEWLGIIAASSTTLLVSTILKATPDKWVERIDTDKYVNEDTEAEGKLLKMWEGKKESKSVTAEGDFQRA